MSTIKVTLRDEHLAEIQDRAQTLGITAEELLRTNIERWLATPKDNLDEIADYLLNKNRELHRRLA